MTLDLSYDNEGETKTRAKIINGMERIDSYGNSWALSWVLIDSSGSSWEPNAIRINFHEVPQESKGFHW